MELNNNEELNNFIVESLSYLKQVARKIEEKIDGTSSSQKPLDNQDLCFRLNVSIRTLQRYRTEKGLPFRKAKQKIFYLPHEVDEWLEKQKKPDIEDL